jgi:serine protease Do
MPAVVAIRIGNAAGSGVIVDAEGHVLTAGHVSGKPDQNCTVILPDGRQLKAKTLGRNGRIDSGMIKLLAKGNYPHVEMGDSLKVKLSQWVLSIGHPGGFKKGRTPVVRLGRVVFRNRTIIRTDCTLVGGDSGGPLFDMRGKVVGIHSRIGYSTSENVHVPVNTYRDTWARLVKGESIERGGAPYLGVRFKRGEEDLKVDEVYKDTPAARAGLESGDVVLGIDGNTFSSRADLIDYLQSRNVGDEVIVVVQRGDEEVKVKLKLGRRPRD